MKLTITTTLCVSCLLLTATVSLADPLPGEILKFQQLPLDGLTYTNTTGPAPTPGEGTYYGHDEWSTLYGTPDATGVVKYQGVAMADDFADREDRPVVHVRWWGSYQNNETFNQPVRRFLIAWETDMPDPGDPHNHADGFSHPEELIQYEVVTLAPVLAPASGTFTEKLWVDVPDVAGVVAEDIFMYNAELKMPFHQQPDTVYWLKIAALYDVVDPTLPLPLWGWHNRDYSKKDPLASVFPPIFPGEHNDGPWDWDLDGPDADDMDVYHFQDDSVSAQTIFDPASADSPVTQTSYKPQMYVDWLDGPGGDAAVGPGISQFSKDLAFELYTIPEPATLSLVVFGAVAALRRRKRQRS